MIEPLLLLLLLPMDIILDNSNIYKSIIPVAGRNPNSSTIIAKIKSVWDSGKYKYFWILFPNPYPLNKSPLFIAI